MTEIVFLGTNGWYDTKTGNTVSIFVKGRYFNVIFDAGNGFYKVDDYIEKDCPVFLFLSHFHLDHITGLHVLNKMKRITALKIFGPAGARAILGTLINSPFTMPLDRLPFPVEVHELPADGNLVPFHLECKPLMHTTLTLGYRLEADERVIAYCPDTGYCENAVSLSRNADLVIAECAYKSGMGDPHWPHLNPESASRIAQEAGAERLALVHFDASIYATIEERKEAEKKARSIFKNSFAAEDDMRIRI